MGDETEALRQREGDQALPIPNNERSCQQRFMDWVNETAPPRMELGLKRYGTLLQPFNGRDFMRDSFEELFDLSVYMQGVAVERQAMLDLLYEVATIHTDERDGEDLILQAQVLLRSMGQLVGEGSNMEQADYLDDDLGKGPAPKRYGHDQEGSQCYYELCGGSRLDPCYYTPEEIARFQVELEAEEARAAGKDPAS